MPRHILAIGLVISWCLLAACTFATWQHRFERTATPPNPSFLQGPVHWQKSPEGVSFEHRPGASTIVRLTASPQGPPPSLSRELKAESQRYVWVRCDYASDNLKRGDADWRRGRVICYGVNRAGVGMFQRPHGLGVTEGTQPWRREEMVFELDPRMEHVWVSVQNMGSSGEYAVRDLQVAFVRNRPMLKWQVMVLLLAWCVWLVGLIRVGFINTLPLWRCVLAATCVLVLFWFLALPGIGTAFRPLAAGQFAGLHEPPPKISTLAFQTPAVPSTSAQPNATSTTPAVTRQAQESTPPSRRQAPMLEWVDRKWDVLHAAVFFGLTLALLTVTQVQSIWRLSIGTTALIQGVEWMEIGYLGVSDAIEMLWAILGTGIAMWLWRRWQRRSNDPSRAESRSGY